MFHQHFRWAHVGSWTVQRAMGKEQRGNGESLVRFGTGLGLIRINPHDSDDMSICEILFPKFKPVENARL